MRFDYECLQCLKVNEEYHPMMERPIIYCRKCGGKCVKLISSGVGFIGVNGRNDMYSFTDFNTTGKPVVINSRTQWKNHLKKYGLHDDVKNDPMTKSDIESMQRYEKRKKEDNRRKIKDSVTDVVRNIPSYKLKERAKQVIRKGGNSYV